jgi:methionine-rich copper-binding protein CopC
MNHRLRRLLTFAVAVLAVACTRDGVQPAFAHTDLVGAAPEAGEVVAGPPTDLTLTFTDTLLPEGAQVLVRDERSVRVSGAVAVSGGQARVPLRGTARPGTYRVAYRVVASDGHPVTGSYRFRVVGTSASAARPAAATRDVADRAVVATAAGPPGGPSASAWVVAGLGAVTLALVLGLGAARRRTPRDEEAR